MPATEPAVEVRGLKVAYGPAVILNGVDMTVQRGEVRVILGGSGCGKSTLLKGIIGLAPVVAGCVKLLGEDITSLEEKERTSHLKRIGVLFQNGALLGSMTVAENIALPLKEHTNLPASIIEELVRMKLELVGLEHAYDKLPAELSGGMRKRVALARAMIMDPDVLFCDEPSAGLDPLSSAELDTLILKLRNLFNMAVVIVTHELQSIEAIADSLTFLAGGKAVAEGPMAEVRAAGVPEVDNFFARHTGEAEEGSTDLATLLDL